MSGARSALKGTGLLKEELAYRRDGVSHQVGLVGLRREKDGIDEALGDHRRDLREIGLPTLKPLLDEIIDLAVEALGQSQLPRRL